MYIYNFNPGSVQKRKDSIFTCVWFNMMELLAALFNYYRLYTYIKLP